MREESEAVTDTEEAADFARVAAMTAGGKAAPGVEPEQEPARQTMDAAESMAGLLVAMSSVAGYSGLKKTAALWTPEICADCAEKAVPVLRKYPWGARVIDFFETGAGVEELALGAFMVPMGFATWQAVKSDMSGGDERPQDTPRQPDAPATVTVTAPDLGGLVEVHGRANQ